MARFIMAQDWVLSSRERVLAVKEADWCLNTNAGFHGLAPGLGDDIPRLRHANGSHAFKAVHFK
jgi:hypothetical protein